MKKTICFTLIASGLMALGACDNSEYDLENQIPERFHKIIYLNLTGKQDLTLYKTEDDNIYTLSVVKGGSDPSLSATADVKVMTQAEVDEEYSNLEGVNYKVIDSSCYSFDNNQLSFAANEDYKLVNVALNPSKVLEAIEGTPDAQWVLPLYLSSETDSINANKRELFLQLSVVTPSIGFVSTDFTIKSYTYGRVPESIVDSIGFKLDTSNKWDITCQFGLQNDFLTTYNQQHGSVFQLVPKESYAFAESMPLAAGANQTALVVAIQGAQLAPGDYMLPIELQHVSQFEIATDRSVRPVAFRVMGKQLDRSDWTAKASSEELSGEGAVNGKVSCLIDGDLNTYWHSKWQNGGDPLPHDIIIDTKKEVLFSHFSMIHRQSYAYVRGGDFYVSDDKTNWTKVGSFEMTKDAGAQIFGVAPTKGRYFKISITSSYNGTNATLAEVYAYGVEE